MPIQDTFESFPSRLESPARSASAVTPDDDSDLERLPRALYVGTGGDVTVILADDVDPVTYKSVPTGTTMVIRARRVMATGTDADDIVAEL